jgi:hypothetical protein
VTTQDQETHHWLQCTSFLVLYVVLILLVVYWFGVEIGAQHFMPQAAGRIWVWFDSLKRTFSSKAGRDRVNEDSRWLCAGCKGKFYTTHRMATWYSAVQFFPLSKPHGLHHWNSYVE